MIVCNVIINGSNLLSKLVILTSMSYVFYVSSTVLCLSLVSVKS